MFIADRVAPENCRHTASAIPQVANIGDDMLTQKRLKELMSYDPDTGVFTRNKSSGGKPKGSIVGSVHSAGYIETQVDGSRYYCHRLAFLYMTGSMPKNEVDHINRNPADNRWSNLRNADRSQNNINTKAKGYYFSQGKYCAQIRVNNKVHYLGRYSSASDARQAYIKAGKRLHGEFFCIDSTDVRASRYNRQQES